MQYIERNSYLKKLIAKKDTRHIKLITGMRRCGKSTLLTLFQNYLKSVGVKDEQIISIDFEEYRFKHLRNHEALLQFLSKSLATGKRTYVFLDEIQHLENFSRVLSNLTTLNNIDLYIPSSCAHFLALDSSPALSGNYSEIPVWPLSYQEFIQKHQTDYGSQLTYQEYYDLYIHQGGFPQAIDLENKKQRHEYLDGLYASILMKDVMLRTKQIDPRVLQALCCYLMDHIGYSISIQHIANSLLPTKQKIDVRTIERYIGVLKDSLLLFKVPRYNIKEQSYLNRLEKYYVADLGLRHAVLDNNQRRPEHILKNVVYLELLRRGYKVFVGKFNSLEVNFVAQKDEKTLYIQVAVNTLDEMAMQQKIAPFQLISDNSMKLLLTLDDIPERENNGYIKKNALEWLLEIKI